MSRRYWIFFAFLLAGLPVAAQLPRGETLSANLAAVENFTFTKDVNQVNLLFTTDGDKSPSAQQLSPGDVSVSDDNKAPAAILKFRTEQDLPLRVGLLIDTSDSVRPVFRFEKASATAFVRELVQRSDDRGFILGFAHKPTMAQPLTNDPGLLAQGIATLKPGGDTGFFDAVIAGCRELAREADGSGVARILVVLSDGEDNTSRSKLDDALMTAQETETTIYTIETEYTSLTSLRDDTRIRAHHVLHQLAEDTGGRFFSASSVRHLAKAFSRIEKQLRWRYSVLYIPADFRPDGRFRRIKVSARKAGQKVHVRARKGYYARLTASNALPQFSRP
jgi:VWFA-related protein